MQTFTLLPQRWRVVRAFGRNPVVRRGDRVGVLLVLLAFVASTSPLRARSAPRCTKRTV